MKKISIRKMREYLTTTYALYRKKKTQFSAGDRRDIESSMRALYRSVTAKDTITSSKVYSDLQNLSKKHFKKNKWLGCVDFVGTFLIALLIAIAARALWFELYQIPTGSMRPTFCEEDRVMVSKTVFGINVPLMAKHLYFDPNLILRNGIFIFTGENIDISNGDMRYFYLFPGKKQYIKRLIGKPGDILYFYGGKIYGLDREGKDITNELNPKNLEHIEHIPYLSFEGRVKAFPSGAIHSPVILSQMNLPIAELSLTPYGKAAGKLLTRWQGMEEYFNIWGCKNYGTARLLSPEQLLEFAPQEYNQLPKGLLYAEILHHPDIKKPFIGKDLYGRVRPIPSSSKSYLPLQEEHLKSLFANLNTSRFMVQNGKAYRYGTSSRNALFEISLPNVPDGTYEFIRGTPYQIYWKGLSRKLPTDHPLAQFSIDQTHTLFNVGIEFDARYIPKYSEQNCNPARYCYFRDNNLYFLGAPILHEGDVDLVSFITHELEKRDRLIPNYLPFVDSGPPITKEGSLDKGFIEKYGLCIPDSYYLALGDNHAMSADSRDFGFVPQNNIRGAPKLIFWPFGERAGKPLQSPYPMLNFPRICIWSIAILSFLSWTLWKSIRQKILLKELGNSDELVQSSLET